MNTLQALRGELAQTLESAGAHAMPVTDHLPDRIVPPAAFLVGGSPYLEGGDVYGTFIVRHTVLIVVPSGPNESTTDALDELITASVVALDEAGWAIERVDQPVMLSHGNAYFMSVHVDVQRDGVRIDDGQG